jgi:hypothetical protein
LIMARASDLLLAAAISWGRRSMSSLGMALPFALAVRSKTRIGGERG